MKTLQDTNGKTIVDARHNYFNAIYAGNVSRHVARITAKTAGNMTEYAVNVTYINPETGKAFRRCVNVYLKDFLSFYRDDKLNADIIAGFMRDFLYNHVFCTGHTGKMAGINSCSTSALNNPRCKARACNASNDCICKHCFAITQMSYQKSTGKKYARNTNLLTSIELLPEWIPAETDNDIFRFESFGDLANTLQYKNYVTIASARPDVIHSLWTKNADIIEKSGIEKPGNMFHIESSPYVNTIIEKRDCIDKVFTVWTSEEEAKKHGVTINCGARCCDTCRNCYQDGVVYVHELLK